MAFIEILERDLAGPRTRMEAHLARKARLARMGIVAVTRNIAARVAPAPEPFVVRAVDFGCDVGKAHVNAYRMRPRTLTGWSPRARIILSEVCEHHRVLALDLVGPRKFGWLIPARNELAYRLSAELQFSLPQIGRLFGGRDHTTILHAIRRHAATLRDRPVEPSFIPKFLPSHPEIHP